MISFGKPSILSMLFAAYGSCGGAEKWRKEPLWFPGREIGSGRRDGTDEVPPRGTNHPNTRKNLVAQYSKYSVANTIINGIY